MINEIKRYEVYGFEFDTYEEAEEFNKKHEFVFDDFENGYLALCKKDIEHYSNKFINDKIGLFENFRNLCNSNSMGSLQPLAVISYVFQKNNVNPDEVWEM